MRTVAQVAKDVLQEVIILLLGIWLRNPNGACLQAARCELLDPREKFEPFLPQTCDLRGALA